MVRAQSSVKELYVLDGGGICLDKSLLTRGIDQGKRIRVPVPMFLVVTDYGNILIDTGMNPEVIENPKQAWGKEVVEATSPQMSEENRIERQLQLIGLGIKNIKYIVNSHLHLDHAGGNRLFLQAEHVVQKAEFRFARYPDNWYSNVYMPRDLDFSLNWRLIEGDTELVPGVRLILTNGHSPGHQSTVLYDIPHIGTVILCHDAVYMHENVERELPPGICWDGDVAISSMQRITNLAHVENAEIIVGHDPEYWKTLPLAPKPYSLKM